MTEVPPEVIEDRRRKGLDRLDEVWEGVYHMVPPPSEEHQEVTDTLFGIFFAYIKKHGLGVLRTIKGVRDRDDNYRIPEWIFLRAGRESLLKRDSGYVDEGPDVVLEVRSPGDETDAKIPFYEKVGTRELLLIDRDTRRVELLRRVGKRLTPVSPNAEGWIYGEGLRAFFRTGEKDGRPALLVRFELEPEEHAV